jgi:hypothetical protein
MSGFSGVDGSDVVAFVPAITAGGGGFTNANGGTGSGTGVLTSSSVNYKKLWGKLYWLEATVAINTIGNATGPIIVSLPFTAARYASLFGSIWSTVGSINGIISSDLSLSSIYIYTTNATTPGGNSNTLHVSGLVWSA